MMAISRPHRACVRRGWARRTFTIEATSNRSTDRSQSVVLKSGNTVLSSLSSTTSYIFDSAGNLLGDGLRAFQYDAENRHSATVVSDSDEGSQELYRFNALGQRTFKSDALVDHTAPSQSALGSSFIAWLQANFAWLFQANSSSSQLGAHFSYADPSSGSGLPPWALLGEYGNSGNSTTGPTEYIWMPVEGPSTSSGQALLVAFYRNNRFYSVHTDHLGTPRVVRDDAGAVVWQLPFSPYGELKPSGPYQFVNEGGWRVKGTAPLATFNLRFPGQYVDQKTNLSYNLLRSYDATSGRYTQSDPIGLEGGLNRFGYVGGNPLSFTDPLGLYTEVVVWQGVGIGSSSFGHVSTNVNGQNFSWGPGGWDTKSATAAEYNRRQLDFRGGTGIMLNLSPKQEAALASCMRAQTAEYNAVTNNCGNPVQQCLNAVGAGIGDSLLPSSILESLRSSPNANGSVSYPSPRPSSGFGGGLLWR